MSSDLLPNVSSVRQVLVSVSDMETAEEMVKVNAFSPMKIGDCELKMTNVKQHVGLTTPVRLLLSRLSSVVIQRLNDQ